MTLRALEAPRTVETRLDELARRSARLAAAIEASSVRSDVRDRRATIVLLLLELRCPDRGGQPRRDWYVRGGVARLGAIGIRRAWRGFTGEEPLSLKSTRKHLAELERVLVLVRSPGDWMPSLDPKRRPRYSDTLHLLVDEQAALWWAGRGRDLLEQYPQARTNPTVWRQVFDGWRDESRRRQLPLPYSPERRSLAPVVLEKTARLETARKIRAAARVAGDSHDLLATLRSSGVGIRGRFSFVLAGDPRRLRGAAALLARALERGDRIRSLSGWLVSAWRRATPAELSGALRDLLTQEQP